ncbi:MAG: hypothetical protein WCC08_22685 [Terrimicrobiaceae bacterium]
MEQKTDLKGWPSGSTVIRWCEKKGDTDMNNIFYIIGVVVVVIFIAGYFGLR